MKTLRIARIENGWSQTMLAKVCDLTQATISNLETGRTQPADRTRRQIETLFGPIDWDETRKQAVILRNGHQTAIETKG
ncbi:MAG: helix-turn-helix transcriptional regulator [Balneolaceae bacterium]